MSKCEQRFPLTDIMFGWLEMVAGEEKVEVEGLGLKSEALLVALASWDW